MNEKEAVILYQSLQYDCCGPYFSVGEYIWWNFSKSSKIIDIGSKKINIDYICENCWGGDILLSGKIRKIQKVKNNQLINCKESSQEKGIDFIINLEEIEEYSYNTKNDNISFLSNPYLNTEKYGKIKDIYNKIYIISDIEFLSLNIAKYFKKNHFEINLILKNKIMYNNLHKELKNIKSYSQLNHCSYIDKLDNSNLLSIDNIDKSLVIFAFKNEKNKKYYDKVVKNLENEFNNYNACYILEKNNKYDVEFVHKTSPKSKQQIKKYLNKTNYTDEQYNYILNNPNCTYIKFKTNIKIKNFKSLIKFLSTKERKNVKISYYNNYLFYFFVVVYVILKIIQAIIN